MDTTEFEVTCLWIAARLRGENIWVNERDPTFRRAVSAARLANVAQAVGLSRSKIADIAQQLAVGTPQDAPLARLEK